MSTNASVKINSDKSRDSLWPTNFDYVISSIVNHYIFILYQPSEEREIQVNISTVIFIKTYIRSITDLMDLCLTSSKGSPWGHNESDMTESE